LSLNEPLLGESIYLSINGASSPSQSVLHSGTDNFLQKKVSSKTKSEKKGIGKIWKGLKSKISRGE